MVVAQSLSFRVRLLHACTNVAAVLVAFAITAAASAEAASAAAAVLQAWSDLDQLDQDCSATMKADCLRDDLL